MTPKEIVLSGYRMFAEGNLVGLKEINHKNALFKVNGNHKRSGEYKGFDEFRDHFLAHLESDFPNFKLEVLHVVAEESRVHVYVHYTADNLSAHGVHMFFVEDGLQKEFIVFDDSQKLAAALGN